MNGLLNRYVRQAAGPKELEKIAEKKGKILWQLTLAVSISSSRLVSPFFQL
jgi:hypothetical protein